MSGESGPKQGQEHATKLISRKAPTGCLLVLTALLFAALGAYWGARLLPHEAATPHAAEQHAAPAEKQLWTCSMHPQVIREAPGLCPICHMQLVPVAAAGSDKAATPGAVTIAPEIVQNMGVRTATVKRGKLAHELRLTGYLSEAQPKVREINLRVSGWIEKLYANYDGQFVEAGAPLFELYSPEVRQTAGELIQAAKGGGHFTALAEAARRKLSLWGIDKAQIDRITKMDAAPRTVTFYSPTSGHVLEKAVLEGASVMAGQRLMNIVDHSELWMEVTVFEKDLPFVSIGDTVHAETEANPGEMLHGEVSFIHPHVDMTTRAATARLVLENRGMTFRPGMYATATLGAAATQDVLLIPRSAVLDTGVRQVVFVAKGEGQFAPSEVKIGGNDANGDVEVVSGLDEGDTVVSSGQFLLDSESRLKEAVEKYRSGSAEEEEKPEAPSPAPAHESHAATPRDAVFKAYFALQEAMSDHLLPADGYDMKALAEAVGAYASTAAAADQEDAAKLRDALKVMSEARGEAQHEAFKAVGAAMIGLAKGQHPSPEVAPNTYVVFCPMANASWLQRNDSVANPYLDMKDCGEVKETLPAGSAS